MEDNKQLIPTAPTVHCTLPFCIALCSVELVGLAVVVGHAVSHQFDVDELRKKSLCKIGLKLPDIMLSLCDRTKMLR